MSAAVIIHRRQRQIMRAYHAAGALDPVTACRPEDLGVASHLVFHGLVRRGVLVDSGEGRYYIDMIAAERFARRRRARAWAWLGVLLILFAICLAVFAR